jgi:uncharacterized protein (DUF934 family)
MPVIDKHAQVIEDFWDYPDQALGAKPQMNAVLTVDDLHVLGSEPPVVRPIGVYAPAGTTADVMVPYLNSLDLVLVEFPKFRDGRGFTLARTLRDKLGFRGDIRAIGHVLPDQFAALIQCGFTSIVLPGDHPAEQWKVNAESSVGPTGGPFLRRLLSERTASAAGTEKT